MVRRTLALAFSLAVSLSWAAPLCAATAPAKSAHSCCPVQDRPKAADPACCCRPLDKAAQGESSVHLDAGDALLPAAAALAAGADFSSPVDAVTRDVPYDASPQAPTGLAPPPAALS